MKLLQEEYDQFQELFNKSNLTGEVAFVKLKGWVFLQLGEMSMSFHRKTTSKLVDGKFTAVNKYYTRTHEELIHNDFSKVLSVVSSWIRESA